jgi:hypothetical protein
VDAVLAHWVGAFLAEPGFKDSLLDQRHPLRCIERDLNKMGLPGERERRAKKAAKARARQHRADNEENERRRNGQSLAGSKGAITNLLGAIGKATPQQEQS